MDTLKQTGLSFAPIVHLTDLHLSPPHEMLHGFIDTWARLRTALDVAGRMGATAVVVTGDIGDRSKEYRPSDVHHVYDQVAEMFSEFTEATGCPVIATHGNHDPHWALDGMNPGARSVGPEPGDTVTIVDGLRIIGMNSHGFGVPSGRFTAPQLSWLETVIQTPAPRGTLLAFHHPAFTSMVPIMAGRGLAFTGHLERILEGSDVRAILCGHYHSAELGFLGSTPVWAGPSLSTNFSLMAEPGTRASTSLGALSIMNPSTAAFTTVTIEAGELFNVRSDGTLDGFKMSARAA